MVLISKVFFFSKLRGKCSEKLYPSKIILCLRIKRVSQPTQVICWKHVNTAMNKVCMPCEAVAAKWLFKNATPLNTVSTELKDE